jgi:two-component system nitrogen regulation response regulator GlnG
MSKILVIDDDRTVHALIRKAFSDSKYTLICASDAEEGRELLESENPDVMLLDIRLPGMNGLEFAKKIKAFDAKLPVIFITSVDNSNTAIEAMKLGAYEFQTKPLDVERVQDLVERALGVRRMMQAPVHLPTGTDSGLLQDDCGDAIVGKSPTMLEVYKQIGRVAAQDVTVLIRGESGTGKELICRALYQHSHRNNACFLAVNCAALSETLLESELFGHEKGAFTGADRRRVGKFEQCNNGTIFLDEIGDMAPSVQSKVLRLIQEQKFERLGGTETIETNVRLISATNRDLEQMIEDGDFRLDLFHRINGFEIELPPLRERGEDIELLTEYFIKEYNKQLNRNVTGLSPETMSLIKAYSWPGNLRELQGALRRSILMSTGPVIVPEWLPAEVCAPGKQDEVETSSDDLPPADLRTFVRERLSAESNNLYEEALGMFEKYLITSVLQETSGNQSKAAEKLGITRGSLRTKIRVNGIQIDQVIGVRD